MKRLLCTLRPILLCTLLSALAGCGFLFGREGVFRDKSEDYKKSTEVPEIRLREGDSAAALQEIYPIPPISDNLVLAGEFVVPRPVPLAPGAVDETVRIQTLGSDSWALVSVAPGQLWPQVRAFLSTSQIPVARVDAREGIIETGWVELQGAALASRFRFRMDQGVQRGTSELHVLQMNRTADDSGGWPAASDNAGQESEMLKAVAQFIANTVDTTPVSMVAEQALSAEGKISIQEGPDNDVYIRVTLPYDRAWASLGRALEESSFEITDRDRSTGRYYVRFLGPQSQQEAGWFDWLWGSDSEYPLAGEQFIVSLSQLDPQDVAVRIELQPAEAGSLPPAMTTEDEQSMLLLIKGNID